MIEETKKIEYWNFLTTEKNPPRPKGITPQRLAVIKPLVIGSDVWRAVIRQPETNNQAAAEFYQSDDAAAKLSRTVFWQAVRAVITQGESERAKVAGRGKETIIKMTGKKNYQRNSQK